MKIENCDLKIHIVLNVPHTPSLFDLLALVRRHPLYLLLRVCRELCFE